MTRYAPGSFTKNFGWNKSPPGLSKLRTAIIRGFGGHHRQVERDEFCRRTLLKDENRKLIPVNFFLGNAVISGRSHVSPDELTLVATSEPYSRKFDWLAVFALHLAKVGSRPKGTGHVHAARYLGDFVREQLWSEGKWQADRIGKATIEAFLEDRVIHEGDKTIRKCTNNYSFILKVSGLGALKPVDPNWVNQAYFLAFDRLSLDGISLLLPTFEELIGFAEDEQLYKLMNLTSEIGQKAAVEAAEGYLAAGGIRRFVA